MINGIRFLKSVKREDFALAINNNSSASNLVSPETYFSNLINEIGRFSLVRHFWFIPNLTNGTIAGAGGMVEELTSISKESYINGSPDQLFKRTHPEDIQQMFAFSNYWIKLLKSLTPEKRLHVHPTIYLRLKNNEEIYRWVMVQFADHMFDENGEIIYGLTLITDIDYVKKDGVAMMSILDSNDESCQHFYCSDGVSIDKTKDNIPKLTNREIEVIGFLAIGYTSKQIAAEMEISLNTVNHYRKNMLKKTDLSSTTELVNFAIQAGFV